MAHRRSACRRLCCQSGSHARRKSQGLQRESYRRVGKTGTEEEIMGRGILLYLLGVPIPIIILLALLRY
ncbi:MAG: hypothetical protein E8A46_21905 [Bradyrhizobium sp.]|nr:MAG: hypothetical protein E8A46_21905 [Bradyrhizobium sp.]